jgi:hypothetical protein
MGWDGMGGGRVTYAVRHAVCHVVTDGVTRAVARRATPTLPLGGALALGEHLRARLLIVGVVVDLPAAVDRDQPAGVHETRGESVGVPRREPTQGATSDETVCELLAAVAEDERPEAERRESSQLVALQESVDLRVLWQCVVEPDPAHRDSPFVRL